MNLPSDQPSKLTSADFYKRVESKLSDFDVRGAVRLLSSEECFAPTSASTLNLLREKHPTPSTTVPTNNSPKSSDEALQVTQSQVRKSVMSFASGSAAGPDGFRPQYFKDLLSISAGNVSADVISALTDLTNLMLRGEVNETVSKYLYGASLCALYKKCGGIRPIAIGLSIRRLASKLAVSHAKEIIGDHFGHSQLGFGIRCGCEAAVHATRSHVSRSRNSRKVTLKIDFKNAYNSVSREIMLSAVKVKTPLLYKYFWQCYAKPTVLVYESNIILSATGVQQGDPGGSFLFPLSINHIVNDMESELNVWYQDDGTLSDDPDIVLEDFAHLIELSKEIGLEINPSKCELHFASGHVDDDVVHKFNTLAPGIRVVNDEDFNLLGAPILIPGLEKMASAVFNKVFVMFDRLKDLKAHSAFYLLRNCFAVPKFGYLIRTSPYWCRNEILKQFDDKLKTTLEGILNVKLENNNWIQATLPVSNGGFGIRKLSDISIPAFLGSSYGTITLVSQILNSSDDSIIFHMQEALDAWLDINSTVPTIPHHQSGWDKINVDRIVNNELNYSNQTDIARFLALQRPESNAWINAIPSKHIGTFLDDHFIRVCLALRIGAVICRPHICSCGTFVNECGLHGLSCQKSAGRNPRHSELNTILCQAISAIHVNATLEPPGLFRDDGKQPDGLTLVPWANGRYLVWDATCWDTLAPSYLNVSTKQAGRVAELASHKKHGKYVELKRNNYIFNAFAVETLGPWSQDASVLVNKIGPKLNEVSGDPRSHQYLVQRISLAIQRANASSILCTVPVSTKLDQVFYL